MEATSKAVSTTISQRVMELGHLKMGTKCQELIARLAKWKTVQTTLRSLGLLLYNEYIN